MRTLYFSPTAVRRLTELRPTEAEFNAINLQLDALTRNPTLGFEFPFQNSSRKLSRFDVGRFGFIYAYDEAELDIATVV
jgi:hypothetical protein